MGKFPTNSVRATKLVGRGPRLSKVVLQAGIEILFETKWHAQKTPMHLFCKLRQIYNYAEINDWALLPIGQHAILISATMIKTVYPQPFTMTWLAVGIQRQ